MSLYKSTKKIFAAIFLLAIMGTGYATDLPLKEPGVLNVCSYSEFTPVSYGNGQGFEADLLKAIAQDQHLKINFYPENIYDGIWKLPARAYTKCDVAIGGFTPLNYRKKEGVGFSEPTSAFSQSLLVRKADYLSGRITSYESFRNTDMKIGIVPGSSGEIFAQTRVKEAKLPETVLVAYPSEVELLAALRNKQIAAIARGEVGNDYQAARDKDLVTIAKRDFGETFCFALARSNPVLIKDINAEIAKITQHNKIKIADWEKNKNIFMVSLLQSKA